MKKLIALFLAMSSLFFIRADFSLSSVSTGLDGVHIFYTMQSLNDPRVECLRSGNGFILQCRSRDAAEVYALLSPALLSGESFSFSGGLAEARAILSRLDAEVVSSEQIDQLQIWYGYTRMLGGELSVQGQAINLQIAIRDGTVTVGTPLILGSY